MIKPAPLAAPLAALAAAVFAAVIPAAAMAAPVRLAIAGAKGDTAVLLDMASRRNADGKVQADGLLVFPPAPSGAIAPTDTPAAPAPDHARITLAFDCKARTIALGKMVFLAADDTVMKDAPPPNDPQPAVDPTDAHLLAFACGEAFPAADQTFPDEKSAIAAIRKPG